MITINKKLLFICTAFSILALSCKQNDTEKEKFINENTDFAAEQTKLMLKDVGAPTGNNYPRTINSEGKPATTGMYDWTPGFFPGSLWYLYELTNDTTWRNEAEKWTQSLEPLKTYTGNHDLGFMMYCSFGNASRLAHKAEYDSILIESAESLSSRFSENTQAIKSWDHGKNWNGTPVWTYPVIIDNMMNLELLLHASKISGDNRFHDIAITHANTTLKNQFRDDHTSYHVVDYDTITGDVRSKATAQGFSDNSMWARGQAWAIYGYTMMFRETQDSVYLEAAKNFADVYLKNQPEDLVPVWDFNVGQEGFTPGSNSYAVEFQEKLKDASAAAIVSSALFDLGKFSGNKDYTEYAIKMLKNLASPNYRAKLGENGDFILMHSVGSIPHKNEIDVPLCYADYYFLEALLKYKNLQQ